MEAGFEQGEGQECCLSEGSAPINDIRVTKLLFGECCAATSCSCQLLPRARVMAVAVACLPCCFAAISIACFILHGTDTVGMLCTCQLLLVSTERTRHRRILWLSNIAIHASAINPSSLPDTPMLLLCCHPALVKMQTLSEAKQLSMPEDCWMASLAATRSRCACFAAAAAHPACSCQHTKAVASCRKAVAGPGSAPFSQEAWCLPSNLCLTRCHTSFCRSFGLVSLCQAQSGRLA